MPFSKTADTNSSVRSVVNVFVPFEVVELANAPLGVHLFVTVGTPATDWDSNSSAASYVYAVETVLAVVPVTVRADWVLRFPTLS